MDEALALERESEWLSGNQFQAGVISEAKNAQAVAATSKAELDERQARLAHELALAKMDHVAGLRSR